MDGSFNKLISYEGGFTVLCSWGMRPFKHKDEAARAIIAALNIQKKIYHFAKVVAGLDFNPPVHIGICTGQVYMGIVGNERREIIILGETVERAFLFMQTATKLYGKVYVDYETKTDASIYMDFMHIENIEFAHKLTNHPTFEPIDPSMNDWYDHELSTQRIYHLFNSLQLSN